MRKFIVFGFLLFSLHHVVKPVASGAKKLGQAVYKAAV